MKIELAEHAGFCMGVQRALRLCTKLVKDKKAPIYTLGPIIHNNTVIEYLASLGVKNSKDLDAIEKGSWVLIRSHGITPKLRTKLNELGFNLCDATCPKVARVQSLIKSNVSLGYFVVIIGDHDHAETEGLLGYSDDKGIVLSSTKEVQDFIKTKDSKDKICVVAQTTQDLELFDKLCEELRGCFTDIKIINTVCDATKKRQDEVKKVGSKCECVIVAGGKNSANTTRLYEIAQKTSKKSFHIERAEELDVSKLDDVNRVFITAGASTPKWIIHETADKIKQHYSGVKEKVLKALASKTFFYLILVSYFLYSVINMSSASAFSMAGFALLNMELRRYLYQKLDDLRSLELNRFLVFAGFLSTLFASIFIQHLLMIPLLSYGLFFYMIYRDVSVRARVLMCASNVVALIVALIFIWG